MKLHELRALLGESGRFDDAEVEIAWEGYAATALDSISVAVVDGVDGTHLAIVFAGEDSVPEKGIVLYRRVERGA